MSTDRKYLPYAEAEQRLGRALFPSEWIEALTARETWFLEEGGHGSLRNEPATILPGGLTITNDRQFSPDQQQYGAAQHQQRFMRHQRERVGEWLVERGLVSEDGLAVTCAEFEAAIRELYPTPASSAHTSPAPRYSSAALAAKFNIWIDECRASGDAITLAAAWLAMKARVSDAVTRGAVESLISELPQDQRSKPGRPSGRKLPKK